MDNASTDRTESIGTRLADELDRVSYVRLERRARAGPPRGLVRDRRADRVLHGYRPRPTSTRCSRWSPRCFRDIPIFRSAPGSRLPRRSLAAPRREFIPHLQLDPPVPPFGPGSPTPSAASRRSAPSVKPLLAEVKDDGWFFDTELLMLAQRRGSSHPRGSGRLDR